MLDAGRVLALLWALVWAFRARTWVAVGLLALVAYVFALAVASGFTVRSEGPLSPLLAVLLVLVGPSALPRGPLPALPLATCAVHAPAIVNVTACVVLVVVARRLLARAYHLPQFSEGTRRLERAAVAIVLVAVFEGFSASIRLLPQFMDWGTGSFGVLDSSPPACASETGETRPRPLA